MPCVHRDLQRGLQTRKGLLGANRGRYPAQDCADWSSQASEAWLAGTGKMPQSQVSENPPAGRWHAVGPSRLTRGLRGCLQKLQECPWPAPGHNASWRHSPGYNAPAPAPPVRLQPRCILHQAATRIGKPHDQGTSAGFVTPATQATKDWMEPARRGVRVDEGTKQPRAGNQ